MPSSSDPPTKFWQNAADWLGVVAIDVLRIEPYKRGLFDGYKGKPHDAQFLANKFYMGGYRDGQHARRSGVVL